MRFARQAAAAGEPPGAFFAAGRWGLMGELEFSVEQVLWGVAGALVLLAGFAALAERRRNGRKRLDQVGWVPWNLIQVLAFFGAFAAAALALKL